MTEYLDLRPRASMEESAEIDQNLSPVDHLLQRLRDPQTERLTARDRIAIALLPFFAPKLQATSNGNNPNGPGFREQTATSHASQ